jgi:cytochrome c biogenesis protein CcmG/thiol:disulfide interchange protein DsbE
VVRRRMTALGGLAAAIVLLASCLSVLVARNVTAAPMPRAQLDLPAPAFTLEDLDGNSMSLAKLRGKVVVLAFLDHRCPIANAYRRRINDLAARYADRDEVAIISILSFLGESDDLRLRDLRLQRQIQGDTLPTLIDAQATVARQYGVVRIPTFCIIDASGTLRYVGAFDDARDPTAVASHWCRDAVANLLRGNAVPVRETEITGCPLRD